MGRSAIWRRVTYTVQVLSALNLLLSALGPPQLMLTSWVYVQRKQLLCTASKKVGYTLSSNRKD